MQPADGEYREGGYRSEHGARQYRTYIPARRDGDPAERPLVVMLHGCTQDAADFARGTRANAAADRLGALLLYPEQSASAHPQLCWNWFDPAHQERDRGEAALLAAMTRQVAREAGADMNRIFVAGISAGGAMAQVLAATHPDLFRSLAVHSSPPYGSARDVAGALDVLEGGVADPAVLPDLVLAAMGRRARPVPTLVIHGHDDPFVGRVNGEQVLRQWAGVAARFSGARGPSGSAAVGATEAAPCPALPGLTSRVEEMVAAVAGARGVPGDAVPSAYTRCVYDGAPVPIEYWLVPGLGHAWAGGSPEGTYTDPGGPDATSLIFTFFLEAIARAP
jgi:poly(hydroxyalkanoate) depolymerase family esterase